jgi:phosphopantothenoylcysteine decarboxylase/phosphopantothenate--cysteine ligase
MAMKFLITAGATREFIDPVRFLSNPSTGKMGFEVARAARAAGHEVTLVAGATALSAPKGVKRVDVVSARDMLSAVLAEDFDCMVATAAVADWRPKRCARRKIKKSEGSGVLELVRNPDVLKTAAAKRRGAVFVGFAAETGDPVAEAARKCREKKLDFTVANDVTENGCGFGVATNRVALVRPDGDARWLPMMSKAAVARHVVRMAQEWWSRRGNRGAVSPAAGIGRRGAR